MYLVFNRDRHWEGEIAEQISKGDKRFRKGPSVESKISVLENHGGLQVCTCKLP